MGMPSSDQSRDSSSKPTLDVGLVMAPGTVSLARDTFDADVRQALEARFPQVGWNVVTQADRLTEPPVTALDLMEAGRDRMLDENWDLVLVITDLPLRDERRTVKTQFSVVHSVGLIVAPALGVVHIADKITSSAVTLIAEILDFDTDDDGEDIVRRARERAEDVPVSEDENSAQFAARVLGGNVGVLMGLVKANRPLTFALRLSQLIAVTAAAGVLMLITPDIWVLAANYGVGRLTLMTVIAIVSVTASLIVGAKLWERPRRKAEREQVMLFNVATMLTVCLGVMTFYLAVFVLALAGSFLLLEGHSFEQLSSEHLSFGKILSIAWMTTSLATIGGAVGAGLEEDDVIRTAAYTQEPEEETGEAEVAAH